MHAPLAPRRLRFRCAVWGCVLGFGFRVRPASPSGCVGVCVCSCARLRGLPHLLVGVAVRGCVFVRAPRLFPAFPRWAAVCWRACWARVSAVPCPSWLGVSWFGFVLSVAVCPCTGPCGPCPPIPFVSGWAAGSFFFFSVVCVCMFRCPFSCWAAVPGLVLPVSGWVVPLCLFGGPVFGAFWVGHLAASCGVGWRFGGCGLFSRPPPLPPLCFFFLGGACLFLPLPSLGWRTHWPAFSVVFRAAVGGCVLLGRVLAQWVGWAMYTLGSAPLSAALGPSSAGLAAAPGGCVGLWVRGLGCPCHFSSALPVLTFWVAHHRCCRARGGPVCGLRSRCVACWCGAFRGVRWLVWVSLSG